MKLTTVTFRKRADMWCSEGLRDCVALCGDALVPILGISKWRRKLEIEVHCTKVEGSVRLRQSTLGWKVVGWLDVYFLSHTEDYLSKFRKKSLFVREKP